MSKKTLSLIVGLVILTVILLAVALRPLFFKPSTDQPSDTAQSVTPTPPAYTTINLSPNPVTLSTSGSGEIEAVVDSKENSLSTVQLEVSYDPTVLTNVVVTPGEFLPNVLTPFNSIDTQKGRISYALGITPAQTPVQGQGVVARITFDILPGATGETRIELLPKTKVTQYGIGASVLKETSGTTVVIPAGLTAPEPKISIPPQATAIPVQ